MTRQGVSSSTIRSIGYEYSTLEIEFNTGSVYQYSGVPVGVYQGLMSASSHGTYFNAYIKGVYPYRQVG